MQHPDPTCMMFPWTNLFFLIKLWLRHDFVHNRDHSVNLLSSLKKRFMAQKFTLDNIFAMDLQPAFRTARSNKPDYFFANYAGISLPIWQEWLLLSQSPHLCQGHPWLIIVCKKGAVEKRGLHDMDDFLCSSVVAIKMSENKISWIRMCDFFKNLSFQTFWVIYSGEMWEEWVCSRF